MSSVQATAISETVRAAFDFSVDKFPLSGPDNMKTDQYGLFRSDTGHINGIKSISKDYVTHTTEDVCALVDAAADAFNGEVECKTHFDKGHYVEVIPTNVARISIFGTNDNIFPRIMIRAGLNAESFIGSMAWNRDACDNLAEVTQVAGTRISIRHTSGLRENMTTLVEQFGLLKTGWENMIAAARQMQSRRVRMADFLNGIYDMPSEEELTLARTGKKVRKVTIHRNRTQEIWDRLENERVKTGRPISTDGTVSAWEAYNAVQGYVQWDSPAREGFTSRFARILKSARSPEVRQAEKLALAA